MCVRVCSHGVNSKAGLMVSALTAYSTQERSSSRVKHRWKIEGWNNRRDTSTSRVHVVDVVLYAVRFFESLSFIIQFLINIEDPVCWSVNHRPTGNLSSFPFVGEMFSIPLIHLLKQVPCSKPVVILSQPTNFFCQHWAPLSHTKSPKWLKYCLNQVQTDLSWQGALLGPQVKAEVCHLSFSLWLNCVFTLKPDCNLKKSGLLHRRPRRSPSSSIHSVPLKVSVAFWNQASECSHLIAFGKTQG